MFCQECGKDIPQGSKFCPECGFNYQTGSSQQGPPVIGTTQQAPPVLGDVRQTSSTPQVAPQQPTTQFDAGSQGRTPDLVYPKNPPLSPHFCWLGWFLWGVPQIIHGQIAKGILLLLVCMFVIPLLVVTVIGLPLAILIQILLVVDSYKVGKTLKTGKPVGKWRFFPSQ
jgi:TM2 domain-containing membrane protein YozV